MRVSIRTHIPGRRLTVVARAGAGAWLSMGTGLMAVPALLAAQALLGISLSPGVELPLLVATGGLLRAGTCHQQVTLQDGDALVQWGLRRFVLPGHRVRRAVLLEAPARLALEVDLPDSAALRIEGGRATVLATPWPRFERRLAEELEGALERLGLSR
jgi:hypothetical protein